MNQTTASHSLFATVLAFLLLLPVARDARAAEGGYSNYVPGTYGDFAMAVEPEAQLTLRNDVYYYNADGDGSVRSGLIEAEAEVTFAMNMTTLLYKPEVKMFGAQYAFGILLPIVHVDIDSAIKLANTTFRSQDDTTGLGDITLIPLVLYRSRGNLHTSFAHYIITPTGDYEVDDLANPGLNYWSFDTNFALTHLNLETGRELSFDIGHIYNTENDDTDYQTGQELHLDVAFNQFLSESSALGIHGFYLKQITGDSGDGARLGDFKAEAAGIGPAVFWGKQIGEQNVSFIAKWLHEFEVENRLEGDHIFVSFAMDW